MALPLFQFVFWSIGYLLSLLSFLLFRAAALLIVALVRLLKLPSEISTWVIDAVEYLFRSLFECTLGIAKEAAAAAASALFDVLRGAGAGSVQLISAAAAELMEKTLSGLGELSEALPQLVQAAADMVVQVADAVWSSYKNALEYVMQNI